MTEMELLGKKTLELENLHGNYNELLVLLSRVVSGEIDPSRVTVDLTNRSWSFGPPVEPGLFPALGRNGVDGTLSE